MGYKIVSILLITALLTTLSQVQAQAAISSQCMSLETKRQKLMSDYQAKISPLSQLRIKNTYTNNQVPGELKAKTTAIHTKGNKERTVIFNKLRTKAVTIAQKKALDTYKTEYETALQMLRTAQETTQTSYIEKYNNLFATHRLAVDSHIIILKNKINAAFDKAVAQCAKIGLDKSSAQLKSDIMLAQNDFNQTPNVSLASIQLLLQPVADEYKAVNDKAILSFDESIRASDAKLKTAFSGVKYIFE